LLRLQPYEADTLCSLLLRQNLDTLCSPQGSSVVGQLAGKRACEGGAESRVEESAHGNRRLSVWSALDRVEAGREGEVARELLGVGTAAWGSFHVCKLRGRGCLLFPVALPQLLLVNKQDDRIRPLFAGQVLPAKVVV
jgi:hypothetical protein